MASVTVFPAITIVLFGIVALIAVAIILSNERRKLGLRPRYTSVIGNVRYRSGEFSKQMELDMRLPYRRFKQLYPYSTWSYEEYKKMQKQTAFRRSTSSQDNKRMVR
ncbi:MAG: hypothetical protein NWE95_08440 [Candidatus Bathyarchaeota archaeon]|nr:hypothetical protein [Candidatus Bathyarchaeota archaeon]